MLSHHYAMIACFVFSQISTARAAELGKNPLVGAELDDEDISEGSGLDGSCSVDTCPGICCPSTVATILEPTTKPPMHRAGFTKKTFFILAAGGTFLTLLDQRLLM